MKRGIENFKKVIRFETAYSGQELFVLAGLVMMAATLLKLTGVVYIDSDWFWFLAGCGLFIEGMIMVVKQKKFNNKYKVVDRVEYEKLIQNSSKDKV